MKKNLIIGGIVVATGVALVGSAAYAANSRLSQEITAGSLTTSLRTSGGANVALGTVTMTTATTSNQNQNIAGTFGTNEQRITVDDRRGNGNTWSLALAGENASTSWTTGGATPQTYAYNGNGTTTGRLTVTPGVVTATSPNTTTGVTPGAQASFSGNTPITLMQGSASAEKVWNGYMTGVSLSQMVPAFTPPGNYTLNLVQTVTGT